MDELHCSNYETSSDYSHKVVGVTLTIEEAHSTLQTFDRDIHC